MCATKLKRISAHGVHTQRERKLLVVVAPSEQCSAPPLPAAAQSCVYGKTCGASGPLKSVVPPAPSLTLCSAVKHGSQ